MEQRILTIETRDKLGKNACRKLRKMAKVPAVVFGKGMESVSVVVDRKELELAISGEGGINHLLTLKGDAALDGKLVIVSGLTRHCLKDRILHADLHKINLQEKVKVKVPVSITTVAKGIKEGGIQDIVMHEIEIECPPGQIPEHIDLDVSDLAIGESLHVSDLDLPAGLKVIDDPSVTIVNILGRAKGVDEVVAAEAE
jgi:large subunit ribosomal protein L25